MILEIELIDNSLRSLQEGVRHIRGSEVFIDAVLLRHVVEELRYQRQYNAGVPIAYYTNVLTIFIQ